MTKLPRPCLDCGKLAKTSRCDSCDRKQKQQWDKARDPSKRKHYTGDYQRRARAVREAATACYWCHQPFTHDNPVQADHLIPADSNSILIPACRRCNIGRARGSFTPEWGATPVE